MSAFQRGAPLGIVEQLLDAGAERAVDELCEVAVRLGQVGFELAPQPRQHVAPERRGGEAFEQRLAQPLGLRERLCIARGQAGGEPLDGAEHERAQRMARVARGAVQLSSGIDTYTGRRCRDKRWAPWQDRRRSAPARGHAGAREARPRR